MSSWRRARWAAMKIRCRDEGPSRPQPTARPSGSGRGWRRPFSPAIPGDVDGRCEVGHQVRVAALNAEDGEERPHTIGHRADGADPRQLLEPAVERPRRIRVECNACALADAQRGDIRLIHARADLHGRRVHDVPYSEAGMYLPALQRLAPRSRIPFRNHHDTTLLS